MSTIALKDGLIVLKDGLISCECCGPSLTVTCTSLTATPTLCGYSAYEDPNAGPVYKWQTRTLSGESYSCSYSSCAGAPTGGGKIVNKDACQYSGCTLVTTASYDSFNFDSGCSGSTTFLSNTPSCAVSYFSPTTPTITLTPTTKNYSESLPCDSGTLVSYETDVTETLSDPDTIEAAIARATPTEGTSCCAVTGVIGTTTAESTSPLSVGESTSVVMALAVTGAAASTDYVLTLTFKNYVHSTSSEEAETTMVINITTDGSGEWADDVAIPQPDDDHRRCYDRYTLELAP